MVKFDRVDDHKVGQIVFVGSVVSMPSDHVKGTMTLDGLEETAAVLVDHGVLDIQVFEPGRRRFEISRVGQSICT